MSPFISSGLLKAYNRSSCKGYGDLLTGILHYHGCSRLKTDTDYYSSKATLVVNMLLDPLSWFIFVDDNLVKISVFELVCVLKSVRERLALWRELPPLCMVICYDFIYFFESVNIPPAHLLSRSLNGGAPFLFIYLRC